MLKIINYDNKDFYVVDKELRDSLTAQEKEDIKDLYVKLPFSAKNFISVEDCEELINPTEQTTDLVILDAKEYKKQDGEVVIEQESEDYITINDIPEAEEEERTYNAEESANKFSKYMSKLKDKNIDKLVDNYKKYRCHKTTLNIEGFDIPVILYDWDIQEEVEEELKKVFPNKEIQLIIDDYPSGMVVFETANPISEFREQLIKATNYYKGLK